MNIFPLISLIDFVSINLAILENIDQCEVTLWRLILIKTKMFVLEILKYITTSIKTRPIGLAAILVIMSLSTVKSDVILFTRNIKLDT
jgi:hypothetical protein